MRDRLMPGAPRETATSREPHCSFCSKPAQDVQKLIEAPESEAAICDSSTTLNAWVAARPDLPVINAGDFNFDWDAVDGDTDHDQGYDNLTANGHFTWVRPATLVRT